MEQERYHSTNCRICKGEFGLSYQPIEMMFGFREQFLYRQCADCGCLQIDELPPNIWKYYPAYYYSFTQSIPVLKRQPIIKRIFSKSRLRKLYRKDHPLLTYFKEIGIKINDKILDVGCGRGKLICELFNKGFENIEGVDKFVPNEINHGYGVKVMKKDLADLVPNSYDLIMMHHVLEHIPEQQKTLLECKELLKDKGCLLIRIPILGEVWEIYKEDWVQLDAPRHFFLHTVKSMNILAKSAGFEVRNITFDSTSFQYLGSELYKRKIPLFSEKNNFQVHPYESIFTKEQIKSYEIASKELNEKGRGDSAAFYLYKI